MPENKKNSPLNRDNPINRSPLKTVLSFILIPCDARWSVDGGGEAPVMNCSPASRLLEDSSLCLPDEPAPGGDMSPDSPAKRLSSDCMLWVAAIVTGSEIIGLIGAWLVEGGDTGWAARISSAFCHVDETKRKSLLQYSNLDMSAFWREKINLPGAFRTCRTFHARRRAREGIFQIYFQSWRRLRNG